MREREEAVTVGIGDGFFPTQCKRGGRGLMSPLQCQAARALLNLSRSALAAKANCAISTLRNFELELHSLQINNRRTIQRVLEGEGVEFLLAPEGLKFKGKLIDVIVTARDRRPIADGITSSPS